MKSLLFTISIVLLLALASCGKCPECPTMNETECPEINETVCEDTICPDCEDCEVCEECQECDETCEFSGDSIELWLENVVLEKTEEGDNNDYVVAKFSEEEFDSLLEATLRFTAECDGDPGKLVIKLDDEKLFSNTPTCYEEMMLDVGIQFIGLNRNEFVFTTLGNENYKVADIFLDVRYDDGEESKNLYSLNLEPSAGDLVEFKQLNDVKITNFKEYEVEIDDPEELTLSFSGEDRDGGLIIIVNDKQVFNDVPSRHNNKIVLDEDDLEKGMNYITFIGVNR
jgi:hypothetical protein